MITVLIAEDSVVTRAYLIALFSGNSLLKVVGMAVDGLQAVEEAERLKPDVILMDVHMPRMNGYEATRRIMEETPRPIVMMSVGFNHDETAMAFEALEAGALIVVEKPVGLNHPDQAESVRKFFETLERMAAVKVIRHWPWRESSAPMPAPPIRSDRQIQVVAIGASTGGPQVLAKILGGLPRDLAVPILIVQHIASGFTAGLAAWLSQKTRLVVKVAEHGEVIQPGTVYFASEGFQMGVKGGRICMMNESKQSGFCPSVSSLFQSVAEAYGPSAMGILLTGMGTDGAEGLKRLRAAGGTTLAQNEETSVIFGMPKEAICVGAVGYVLSPEQIAGMISALGCITERGEYRGR